MAMTDAKMGNKMIALCSAAIGAIYIAGYFVTQSDVAAAAVSPDTPDRVGSKPAPSAAPAPTKYRDGTYSGTGSNRIGSVTVAVTIKNDKIVDVRITNAATHYSVNLIHGLPQQVIQRQSTRVDVVSGATKSTQDFQSAVQAALAQAHM